MAAAGVLDGSMFVDFATIPKNVYCRLVVEYGMFSLTMATKGQTIRILLKATSSVTREQFVFDIYALSQRITRSLHFPLLHLPEHV